MYMAELPQGQPCCSHWHPSTVLHSRQGMTYILGRHLAQHATRSIAVPAHHPRSHPCQGMGPAYKGNMLARLQLRPRCQSLAAAGHSGMTQTAQSC